MTWPPTTGRTCSTTRAKACCATTTPRPVAPAARRPTATTASFWGGVMHYVELDVNNLRRWLRGDHRQQQRAACVNGAGPATCPMDVDRLRRVFLGPAHQQEPRRADNVARDASRPTQSLTGELTYGDDAETGEFGFEDIINPRDSRPARRTALRWRPITVRRRGGQQPAGPRTSTCERRRCDDLRRRAAAAAGAAAAGVAATDDRRSGSACAATSTLLDAGRANAVYDLWHDADRPPRGPRQPRLLLPARAEAGQRRPRQPAGATGRRA